MLGFHAKLKADGLKGNETNPLSSFNYSLGNVTVSNNSSYIGLCDPDHSVGATTHKIFGKSGANIERNPKMNGFVEWELKNPEYCGVMQMFTPDRVPIISTLAEEFAVFDKFYASVPGPTWPNRMFCVTGTSLGCSETGTWYDNVTYKPFPQPTIFDNLIAAGLTWRNYYDDAPWEPLILQRLQTDAAKQNIKTMDAFFEDAARGTLPSFSWINPRAAVNVTTRTGSNDQHPDHDVRLGESLMKQVYEALRAGKGWNDTLFIITYDEHGGFYDHVPTPLYGPAPDNYSSYPDKNFSFARLGLRIPTVMISPRIPRGTVVSDPPAAQAPTNSSKYELTSIIATMKKIFNLPNFLTKRDAWAATFEDVLSLDVPRGDCPLVLPEVASTLSPEQTIWEASQPLNSLQENFVQGLAHLSKRKTPVLTTQAAAAEFISDHARRVFQN